MFTFIFMDRRDKGSKVSKFIVYCMYVKVKRAKRKTENEVVFPKKIK